MEEAQIALQSEIISMADVIEIIRKRRGEDDNEGIVPPTDYVIYFPRTCELIDNINESSKFISKSWEDAIYLDLLVRFKIKKTKNEQFHVDVEAEISASKQFEFDKLLIIRENTSYSATKVNSYKDLTYSILDIVLVRILMNYCLFHIGETSMSNILSGKCELNGTVGTYNREWLNGRNRKNR